MCKHTSIRHCVEEYTLIAQGGSAIAKFHVGDDHAHLDFSFWFAAVEFSVFGCDGLLGSTGALAHSRLVGQIPMGKGAARFY